MSPANHGPSVSDHDVDESVGTPEDGHDHAESSRSKPGRKKNPDTQAARRDQNRIAQREFRLRKQQKIRDLEARVELLSGNKEETYNQMRDIMRALMQENTQLRGLLKDLGRFIGDGTGGSLAQSLSGMGWQMEQFHAFLNRTETDTAVEAFNAIKASRTEGGSSSTNAFTAEHDGESSKKRRRVNTDSTPGSSGLDMGLGGGGPVGGTPTTNSFASLMENPIYGSGPSNGYGSPIGVPPSSSRNNSLAGEPSSAPGGVSTSPYQTNFTPPLTSYLGGGPQRSVSGPSAVTRPPAARTTNPSTSTPDSLFTEDPGSGEDESVMRRNEAGRLFRYHLDNFRRNPSYCLPRSLVPSLVQRTIAHEQIIDHIAFPELRDRMILMKDRYILAEVVHQLFLNCTIHGDDVLQHTNWEIHRPFLEKYPFLIDESTLAIANKWRRERGESELTMADIVKE